MNGTSKIIKRFESKTGHQVRNSGFLLWESHPSLGVSHDDITEEDHLVEVKNVVLKEGEILTDV